jgi:Zinc finger, C2H2 type
MQLLDLEMHSWSGLGSAALVPGSGLAPTPLPTSGQLDLSFGLGLELGGSVGEAEIQAVSEGEEAAMDFSPFEVQFLSTVSPSSSSSSGGGGSSGPQRAEQRKPKKKEESGSCDECHRSFSRKSDVRRHKKTAHNNGAHECPQCPIKCSRKDALLRHIRDQH